MKRAMIAALIGVVGVLVVPAIAAADLNQSFFKGNGGKARWTQPPTKPPGSTGANSIRFEIPDADAFAGIKLTGFASDPPIGPPSFDFMSNVANGASGGSPRLRISFDDGGSADLRPLAWDGGTWQHVDGSSNNWDNNGGTCGFVFQTTYENIVDNCHAGAEVDGLRVVTDSGWLVSPYVHWVDNITYDGDTVAKPPQTTRSCSLVQLGSLCLFPG